jgi:hypothetical protein
VFTGLFLADEINRTSPKTQSALLEAMAEGQVTVEGQSFRLPAPFHVVATSNPIEYEGTYALPEAQLDRFMVRLAVGYPERSRRGADPAQPRRAPPRSGLGRARRRCRHAERDAGRIERVYVEPDIANYCVDLAAATRRHQAIEVGASPRGSQGLMLLGRARAVIDGRDFVTPEDVKRVAVPVLAHRLSLTTQAWADGTRPPTWCPASSPASPGRPPSDSGPRPRRRDRGAPQPAQRSAPVTATAVPSWTRSAGLIRRRDRRRRARRRRTRVRPDRPGAARAAAGRGARLDVGTAPGPDRGRNRDAGPGRVRRRRGRLHHRHRGAGGVEAIALRYSLLAGEAREVVVAGPLSGDLTGRVPLLHSGPQELVRVEYRFLGADMRRRSACRRSRWSRAASSLHGARRSDGSRCPGGCRGSPAHTSPPEPATGATSATSTRSPPVTGCAGSTGRRPRAAARTPPTSTSAGRPRWPTRPC